MVAFATLNRMAAQSAVREWFLRLLLSAVSFVIALLLAEVVVRIVHPIADGRDNVTLDGTPIRSWFDPGSVYRQVSNEYNAVTTITPMGHRVPGTTGNPDVIFVGDSFTYGWGLNDSETFATIYCDRLRIQCANLGVPGTGTAKQLDRLEQFIATRQWHPREVKLFFFGMSTAWSAGNDFVDNYDERGLSDRRAAGALVPTMQSAQQPAPSRGLAERVIALQPLMMEQSNLMRILKYYWGPTLKSLLVADPGGERIALALHYTRQNLQRLDQLSHRYGFEYSIYLIVPIQDVILGSYERTRDALQSVSPKPVVGTGQLFTQRPEQYYYAYDGHINALGSRRIGEFLIARDRANGGSP
jgi:hypothetical protein